MSLSAAAVYDRVRAACCPISGLTDAELERHVRLIAANAIDARLNPRVPTRPTRSTGDKAEVPR
jgi:hypothetical protein